MKRNTYTLIFLLVALLIVAGCGNMIHEMHSKGGGISLPVDLFGTITSDTDGILANYTIQLKRNRSVTKTEPDEVTVQNGVYTYIFKEIKQGSGYTVVATADNHFEETSVPFIAALDTGENGELDLILGKKWQNTILTGQDGSSGFSGGDSSTATFNQPTGLALTGGHLYVGDQGTGYLREITLSDVTTATWQWQSAGPGISIGWGSIPQEADSFDSNGIAFDGGLVFGSTAFYVAGGRGNSIYKISNVSADIQILSLAGQRNSGWKDTEQSTTEQDSAGNYTYTSRGQFNNPKDVALSPDGNTLYVADTGNHSIRKVTVSTGRTETLAGNRGSSPLSGSQDGSGTQARFNSPQGLALSSDGNTLYVADTGNNRIRTVRTGDGQTGTLTGSVEAPRRLSLDSVNGVLYVSESKRVKKIDINTKSVKIVADFSDNASSSLGGVAYDLANNLCYVADTGRHVIWVMTKYY
jgi:DNA-binding beta-propeller fold protein YncE